MTLIERLRSGHPLEEEANQAADEIELLTKQRDNLLSAAETVSYTYRNTCGSLAGVMHKLEEAIGRVRGER
jgi:hypothetical protein